MVRNKTYAHSIVIESLVGRAAPIARRLPSGPAIAAFLDALHGVGPQLDAAIKSARGISGDIAMQIAHAIGQARKSIADGRDPAAAIAIASRCLPIASVSIQTDDKLPSGAKIASYVRRGAEKRRSAWWPCCLAFSSFLTSATLLALASCRLHKLDPEAYLRDLFCVLPQWPSNRYLELAPRYWRATREHLVESELEREIAWFTIPTPLDLDAIRSASTDAAR